MRRASKSCTRCGRGGLGATMRRVSSRSGEEMVKTPSDDVRVKFEQNHGLPSLIIPVQIKWSGIIIIKTTLQSPRFPRRIYYYLRPTGRKGRNCILLVEMDEEETERKLGMMDPDRSPATTSGVVRRRFSRVGFLPWGGGLAVWVGYLDSNKEEEEARRELDWRRRGKRNWGIRLVNRARNLR